MDYSAFHWSEKARKYAETIGTIFNVKGRVNTVQDLPATGNKVGDLWLVGLTTDPDLIEYAWLSFDNITRWEKLGSTATSLAFSAITGSPDDNVALKNALDGKYSVSNPDGYISGITSAMVTTALGYTPQQQLESGTNIKTINGNSLLGSGNISTANTSLNNLDSTGKNISNWSSNVTNCITEIPQDIKLELNNGTLTLKAGSKVYVPNGVGVFDAVTVANDVTVDCSTTTGQTMVFYRTDGATFGDNLVSDCNSGTTPTFGFFYDTSTNHIDFYTGSAYQGNTFSFPLAIITVSSGTVTSIDQVFNGFGYIGSTVFALPGVELLFGYGRNEDGTLYNEKREITSVLTLTPTFDFTLYNNFFVWQTGGDLKLGNGRYDFWKIGTPGDVLEQDYGHLYNPVNNRFYYGNQNTHQWDMTGDRVVIVSFGQLDASGKISNFSLKNTYRAIDWNDKGIVSSWSMPSRKVIPLTIGASNSAYTAPANGWFNLNVIMNGSNTWVQLYNDTSSYMKAFQWCSSEKQETGIFLPVRKGDVVYLSYNTTISYESWTNGFRFIFAEGDV